MVGNTPDMTSPTIVDNVATDSPHPGPKIVVPSKVLYVPLQFFWNRNPGLALPLIALQYHEVKINLELEDLKNLCWVGVKSSTGVWSTKQDAISTFVSMGSAVSASLFIDYVYLDTDERRRFAQVSHEYLIEQLQFSGDESTSGVTNKIKLALNHPVKELVWVVQPDDNIDDAKTASVYGKQWFNFTDALDASASGGPFVFVEAGASGGASSIATRSYFGGANPVQTAKLQLNGHDRFSERDGRYFNLVQPYQHHENIPATGINVYSFALKPEEHQPSGTCNMSRIDNATLHLNLTALAVKDAVLGVGIGPSRNVKVKVFAVNYNVLRIMSGMGGLAYSN
jgi:hypothetical protein